MRLLNRLTIIYPLTLPGPLENHTSTADKFSLRLCLQHESTSSFYLLLPSLSHTLSFLLYSCPEPTWGVFFLRKKEMELRKTKKKRARRIEIKKGDITAFDSWHGADEMLSVQKSPGSRADKSHQMTLLECKLAFLTAALEQLCPITHSRWD